ncbi:mandelate racemase/muconate lactonizing enzyme family protein [Candidatus Latescibacterota bacterium]
MEANLSRRSFFTKGAFAGSAGAAMLANFGSGIQAAVNNTPLSSSPSELKITDLKCAYMRGHGVHLFVKIYTNQGIVGIGEGMDAVRGTYGLVKSMGDRLKGKNPLDVYRLFEDIRKGGVFGGAQAGVFISVLSAVEIALWDLAGKALGLPVYRLLSGKFRDKLHMYTHPRLNLREPEKIAAECLDAQKAGYDAIKFSLDWNDDPNKLDAYNTTANNKEVERMVNQVAAVREAVGPYMGIAAEMHTRYDLPTGIKMAKALEPYNLMWMEEPIPAENMDSLRQINQSTSVSVCVGENLFLAHDFRKLLDKQAADIVMPDVEKCGGLGEAQRIANLANLYYVPFAPHMVATPLGMMASAHVCASVPNFLSLESHMMSREEQWRELVTEFPIIENSFLTLSEKPGIGIELNEDGVRKYAVEGIPFFE